MLALGAGPLLPETTFRATAEASATAMANPRRRSRALRCSARFRRFGAGGWPDGLPETRGILDGQWPQWPFYQPEADKWPDL